MDTNEKNLFDLKVNAEDILKDARQQIIDETIKKVTENVVWYANRELEKAISPIVQDFVSKEIAPALNEQLFGMKSQIVDECLKATLDIGTSLSKALAEKLTKNMASSWVREAIIKKLLE